MADHPLGALGRAEAANAADRDRISEQTNRCCVRTPAASKTLGFECREMDVGGRSLAPKRKRKVLAFTYEVPPGARGV